MVSFIARRAGQNLERRICEDFLTPSIRKMYWNRLFQIILKKRIRKSIDIA